MAKMTVSSRGSSPVLEADVHVLEEAIVGCQDEGADDLLPDGRRG
jgi:hypothetical protein